MIVEENWYFFFQQIENFSSKISKLSRFDFTLRNRYFSIRTCHFQSLKVSEVDGRRFRNWVNFNWDYQPRINKIILNWINFKSTFNYEIVNRLLFQARQLFSKISDRSIYPRYGWLIREGRTKGGLIAAAWQEKDIPPLGSPSARELHICRERIFLHPRSGGGSTLMNRGKVKTPFWPLLDVQLRRQGRITSQVCK